MYHGFDSLEEYQAFHGLKVDGVLGPVTQRSLDDLRFCGLPDRMENSICKWGKKAVVYGFKGALPGITKEEMIFAFDLAWKRWEKVCDIRASHIKSSTEAVDIIIDTGKIDGPSGTLAWSELPCGSDRVLSQKYDSNEPWVISDNPPQYKIDLTRVACHEIGHVIGIPHIGRGNLMAPTYSTSIYEPQAGDIEEAVRRYGKPAVTPDPTPTPDPTDPAFIQIKFPKVWVIG